MTSDGYAADGSTKTLPVLTFSTHSSNGPLSGPFRADPSAQQCYLGVGMVRSDCFVIVSLDAEGEHTGMVRSSTSWAAEFEALVQLVRRHPATELVVHYGHGRLFDALANDALPSYDRAFKFRRQFTDAVLESDTCVHLVHLPCARNKAVRCAKRVAQQVRDTGSFPSRQRPTIDIQLRRGRVRAKGAGLDVEVLVQDHPYPHLELIKQIAQGASPRRTYRIKGMSLLTQFHWTNPAEAPEEARSIIASARHTLENRSMGLRFV